jgi:ribosome-binding protein aMBF1 (putative translation factor)
MANKRKTKDAVKILHTRYIKDDIKSKELLEKARQQSDIAEKIYQLRKQAGISQAKLAELVGTTQSVISRLEDADYTRHSLEMLRRIATVLHCKVKIEIIPDKKYAFAG